MTQLCPYVSGHITNGKVGSLFLRIPDLPMTESTSEQEKRAPVPYMYRKSPIHVRDSVRVWGCSIHVCDFFLSFGRGAKINTLSVLFTLKVFFGTRHNVPIPLYIPKLVCHNSQNPKVLSLLHFECFAVILQVFFST